MNDAQIDYIAAFYDFFENARDQAGWTEEECSDAIMEGAKSMRCNVDSFGEERFTKQEWLEIFNCMLSFEMREMGL